MNHFMQTKNLAESSPFDDDPNLIELNVLPQRYRRRRFQLLTVLPWVLWVLLLALLYPIGTRFIRTEESFQEASREFQQVQLTMQEYQPLAEEIESLQSELETVNEEAEKIRTSLEEIKVESPQWSELISLVHQETPLRVELDRISQGENQIFVSGLADTYRDILIMAENLNSHDEFTDAQLESITRVNLPQPTPQSESAENLPSPTTTPPTGYTFQITITISGEVTQP